MIVSHLPKLLDEIEHLNYLNLKSAAGASIWFPNDVRLATGLSAKRLNRLFKGLALPTIEECVALASHYGWGMDQILTITIPPKRGKRAGIASAPQKAKSAPRPVPARKAIRN